MKALFITLLFIPSLLFSEEKLLPFSDVERGLPVLVGGCVNTISGDYVESHLDLAVAAADPLTFERLYSSADYTTHCLFWGFRHNHHSSILFDRTKHSSKAYYIEPDGRAAAYRNSHKHGWYAFCPKRSGKGFTNCSTGFLNAKYDLRNNRIYYSSDVVKAVKAGGELSLFALIKKNEFRIEKHKTLSGLLTFYTYGKNGLLSEIRRVNSSGVELANMSFSFDEAPGNRKGSLIIRGSDGREVAYKLRKFQSRTPDEKRSGLPRFYHITEIYRQHGPQISYRLLRESAHRSARRSYLRAAAA